ncbi:replication initiation factor [Nitrosomonas sp. Nm132]|uniref:replication initiation factor n=1 Tax=Nitrosomonas sp. Nm132 TaxID=1881053 RepID=UPI00088D830D|nr:replication initiation factor [Nitrosomonas sp. Nm132]SDH96910.1 hypothetical protein SAMN05428952_10516 [Nitrosomonas sp. Nm132]
MESVKHQSTGPTRRTTSGSEAVCCGGEVGNTSIKVSPSSNASSQGTPPSNTVPNNCNSEYFKLLRFGVDSLYLSYPGELFPEIDEALKELKQIAQSTEPHEQAYAQYPVEDHLFEVKDKGARFFPYILEDNAFRIQLSRSRSMPLAYVKVSSEYLTHVLPTEADKVLRHIVGHFGAVHESANVGRIDLFVDFVSSVDMESWDRHAWVTRASAINTYSIERNFSGWVIGSGGVISCRLYDKTLEIEKQSKKYYLHELWKQAGWNGKDKVWRLEFELKREILTQKGLSKLSEVLNHLNGLWSYATTEWLRLTLPNPDDQTRSRWPIHPLWGYLSSVDWETNDSPLSSRFNAARVPGDDKLFTMSLSYLISFMARENIIDWEAGTAAFLDALCIYHGQKSFNLGLPFRDYIREKVAIKARLFNSLLNKNNAKEQAELEREAREYQKQSDGD